MSKYLTRLKEVEKDFEKARAELLKSPGVRFALKDAVKGFDGKDPVDALNDAAILHDLMLMRYEENLLSLPNL